MKRLWQVFELTVAEQRVIIVLLLVMLGFVAAKTYRDARDDLAAGSAPPDPITYPSP
jgi:hypothetical protein